MPGERTYGASYCPKCLQEDLQKDGTGEGPRELRAYWRSWWDITSVRVCDRHGTHLLQGCPSPDCRMPIVLRGGSLYTCSECRADLTEGSAPTLPGSVGEFQRYVHGRIALAPKVRMPELDDMPICHAEELCWRLGMAERRVSIAPLEQGKRNPLEFQEVCDEGLAIWRDGERAVERMLDRLFARSDNTSGGPVKAYGPFYMWLGNKRTGRFRHVEILRRILVDHALREVPFMFESRLFGHPVEGHTYITTRTAALEASLQYKAFVRTARDLGLMNAEDVHLRRFRRADMIVLTEARSRRSVTQAGFADLFGISVQSLSHLVRSGLVPSPVALNGLAKGYREAEFATIMERIGMTRTQANLTDRHTRFDAPGINRYRTLKALLDGSLVSAGPLMAGDPKSLILLRSDLDAVAVQLRSPPQPTEPKRPAGPVVDLSGLGAIMSFDTFCKTLGLRLSLGRDVLATGLIECEILTGNRGRRISVASVDTFVRTYAFSDTLHRTHGVSWGSKLRDALTASGMTVIRLPRHPLKDLLRIDEMQTYLPTMLQLRHDWSCDYHRNRARRIAADPHRETIRHRRGGRPKRDHHRGPAPSTIPSDHTRVWTTVRRHSPPRDAWLRHPGPPRRQPRSSLTSQPSLKSGRELLTGTDQNEPARSVKKWS